MAVDETAEVTRLTKAMEVLRTSLKDLLVQFKTTSQQMQYLSEKYKETEKAAAKNVLTYKELIKVDNDFNNTLKEQFRQLKSSKDLLASLGATKADLTANSIKMVAAMMGEQRASKEDIALYVKRIKVTEEFRKKEKELEDQSKRMEVLAKGKIATLKHMADGFSKLTHGMVGTVAGFLGISFGLKELESTLEKYNRDLYDATQIGQRYGESLYDMSRGAEEASRKTTLSRQAFAEINKSFKEMYVGIPPTTAAVAGLAAKLQSNLGPSAEATTKAMHDLLSLQTRMPDAMFRVEEAIDAFKRGSEDAISKTMMFRERLIQLGLSSQEVEKYMSMIQPPDLEAQNLLSFERTQEERRKAAADAQLAMAEKLKEVMISLNKIMTKILNMWEAMPKSVVVFGALLVGALASASALAKTFNTIKTTIGWINAARLKEGMGPLFGGGGGGAAGAAGAGAARSAGTVGADALNRNIKEMGGSITKTAKDFTGEATKGGKNILNDAIKSGDVSVKAANDASRITIDAAKTASASQAMGGAGGDIATGGGRVGRTPRIAKMGRLGKFGKLAGGAGRAVLPLAILSAGIEGHEEYSKTMEGAEGKSQAEKTVIKREAIGRGAAVAGGGLAGGILGGAALGAAIGSIVPGIGTVIGGAIGGIAGGVAGSALGRKIGDWVYGEKNVNDIGKKNLEMQKQQLAALQQMSPEDRKKADNLKTETNLRMGISKELEKQNQMLKDNIGLIDQMTSELSGTYQGLIESGALGSELGKQLDDVTKMSQQKVTDLKKLYANELIKGLMDTAKQGEMDKVMERLLVGTGAGAKKALETYKGSIEEVRKLTSQQAKEAEVIRFAEEGGKDKGAIDTQRKILQQQLELGLATGKTKEEMDGIVASLENLDKSEALVGKDKEILNAKVALDKLDKQIKEAEERKAKNLSVLQGEDIISKKKLDTEIAIKQEAIDSLKIAQKNGTLKGDAYEAAKQIEGLEKGVLLLKQMSLSSEAKILAETQKVVEHKVRGATEEQAQKLAILKLDEELADAEAEMAKAFNLGVSAGFDALYKQINVAKAEVKEMEIRSQNIGAELQKSLSEGLQLKDRKIDINIDLKNIKTAEEFQRKLKKVFTDANVDASDYNDKLTESYGLFREMQKSQIEATRQQTKVAQLSKEVMEGYLAANKELLANAGVFGAFIGTTKLAATQLMQLGARGTKFYGVTGKGEAGGGVGGEEAARYGAGGYYSSIKIN